MEALKGYRTEVGDVLFSIQLTLIREEQRAGSRPAEADMTSNVDKH